MSVTTTDARPGASVVTRNTVTDDDSPHVRPVDTRNARITALVAEIEAEDADIERRAEAGDEYAKWLRGFPAANARDRAERALVYRAVEHAEWCAGCGRDLELHEPIWWRGGPYGECCGPKPHQAWRGWYRREQQCETCGRTVRYRWPSDHPACCDRHRWQAQAARRRDARRDARANRPCATCGESFTPPRSDASYCSPACRQKAYRQRKAGAS